MVFGLSSWYGFSENVDLCLVCSTILVPVVGRTNASVLSSTVVISKSNINGSESFMVELYETGYFSVRFMQCEAPSVQHVNLKLGPTSIFQPSCLFRRFSFSETCLWAQGGGFGFPSLLSMDLNESIE
jgi:hypothetical protein